jgi:hypothetical protein
MYDFNPQPLVASQRITLGSTSSYTTRNRNGENSSAKIPAYALKGGDVHGNWQKQVSKSPPKYSMPTAKYHSRGKNPHK